MSALSASGPERISLQAGAGMNLGDKLITQRRVACFASMQGTTLPRFDANPNAKPYQDQPVFGD
jgi:hypothetical protein